MAELSVANLVKLREDIKRKRDVNIQRANEDADRALNALDIVVAMLSDESDSENIQITHSPNLFPAEDGTSNGDIPPKKKIYPTGKWIVEIVNELPSVVTQPAVYKRLVELHSEVRERPLNSIKGQIANVLGKLVGKGQLIVHKEANGTQPAEYRKNTVPQQLPVQMSASAGETVWD